MTFRLESLATSNTTSAGTTQAPPTSALPRMSGETELPPHPPWFAGVKRGAEGQPQPVEGAKSLKADKGGKKGGKKGKSKSGKGQQAADEQPGAHSWEGSSAEWSNESYWQNSQWTEEDWGTGAQSAGRGAPASGAGGGGRRPQPGRERQRGTAADLEDATLSLHKLSLRNATDIRKMKHIYADFWLIAYNTPAVKAGLDGAKEYGALVREKGKGHGLGPPHVTIALRFLHALHCMAMKAHESEGAEEDAIWAEVTIKTFLKETYNEVYGKILATETFLEFDVKEAYAENREEGLMRDDPVGGKRKSG